MCDNFEWLAFCYVIYTVAKDYQILIIDSLNFFQIPLSKFPKTFRLDEAKFSKCDFSFLFNREIKVIARVAMIAVDFATNGIETALEGHVYECIAKKQIVNGTEIPTPKFQMTLKGAISESDSEQSPVVSPNLNFFDILFSTVYIVTPVKTEQFAVQLSNHPDRNKVYYVLNGFCKGFRLGFDHASSSLKSSKNNCPSALKH